jgi:putative membrane protein
MQQPAPHINKDLILRENLAIERTVMANDRTLLSFIRTSLYFFVAGLSLTELLTFRYELLLEVMCFVAGACMLLVGFVKYLRQIRKIGESRRQVGNFVAAHTK